MIAASARLARLAWLVSMTASATFAPAAARAQAFDRVAPQLPAPPAKPEITTPGPISPPPSFDRTVLVPELKGVVFVDGAAALQPAGLGPEAAPRGVAAPGLPLLAGADFASRVAPYIGRPLTLADVDAITLMARETYRANGHPFIAISVPPQNVQRGVIQVVVIEYRVGKVAVKGERYFSAGQIRGMSDLNSGEVLTLPRLRKQLDDFNQNPFLTVSAAVQPGADPGYTDVVLQASDRRPLRIYAGYDNQGVRSLGRDEWNVGFNWGNAFGLGQIMSYQYTRSFSGRYYSNSFSDVIPLGGDHKIILFGAYGVQIPQVAEGFNSNGHSGQASARFASDLWSGSWFKQSLLIGADYKRTNSDLEFSGFRVLDTAAEIVQFPLTYDLTLTDHYGQTVIENQFVYAPGNLTAFNTDEAIGALVPGATANYIYDRLSATRTTPLPHGVTWVIRVLGQATSHNLPYSEQIGGGGIGVVRGYDPNAALGSRGVLASTEFLAPAFSPTRLFTKHAAAADQLQFGAFFDYAHLIQPQPVPDVPSNATLSSIGVNAHYIAKHFTLQIEVGSQLRRAPGRDELGTEAAVVASVGF